MKTNGQSVKNDQTPQAMLLQKASPLKRTAYYALEDIVGGNSTARLIGILLFFLILANAVLVFVMVQFNLNQDDKVSWFYRISTVIFFVEYCFRLWIADIVYPNVSPFQARCRYALSFFGIIDLLAFLPSMITWFMPVSDSILHIINVLRLTRLIKISRYMRGLETISRVIKKSRSEIVAAVLVILLLIVVCSILMYEVEHPAQPDKFNSLLTGIYWAVTTVTGTGYGDIVPITTAGRVIASITMLLSVGLIAIPGGIFSAGFVAEYQALQHQRRGRTKKENDEYFDD